MNDDFLMDRIADGDFLPGVYNYCDRWCERCRFNSRCLTFEMDNEFKSSSPDAYEDENFINNIDEIFNKIISLLKRFAEKEGIDLSYRDAQFDEERSLIKQSVDKHPLKSLTFSYAQDASEWFKNYRTLVTEKLDRFKSLSLEEPDNGNFTDDFFKIYDCIDIAVWYHTMIHVKTIRALNSYFDTRKEEKFRDEDVNVAAKTALLGISRSIRAWKILKNYFEDEAGIEVEDLIKKLESIEFEINNIFPTAESFKRPYFDE